MRHPERNPVHTVVPRPPYGTKFVVRCSIETPDGRSPCVFTVWMREEGNDLSRLVTAYPADPDDVR